VATSGGPGAWTSAQRWVLALTALASLMVVLDALVVTTALSAIRADLGASLEALEWTVSAYVLSFAVLLMTAAALGDRFGRRRVFATGLGVFAASSAGCALAPDVGWLIAARGVQGMGAALIMPLSLTLLGEAFPPQQRPRALGMFAAVSGLSVALGPLLGGAIVEGISWPWIFWLNVPVALALILLVPKRIEESFGPNTALDVRGLTLVTAGAVGIVWGLVRGNSAGWGSLEVLSALTLGALLMLAFVLWELRAGEPMLPMRLFRSRSFSAGNAAIFFQWASALGALFFMAQFLQTPLRLRAARSGAAAHALGTDDVHRPSDRRRARGSLRRASFHRRGAVPQRGLVGLDSAGRRARPRLLADGRSADHRRRRHRDGPAGEPERRPDLRRAPVHG
jgi:EmrB/QacA subfamily drug resistance transporter